MSINEQHGNILKQSCLKNFYIYLNQTLLLRSYSSDFNKTTMSKNFTLLFFSLGLLLLSGITGCKKENSDDLSNDEEASAARLFMNTESENQLAFNDVFDNVMGVNAEVGIGGTGVFGKGTGSIGGTDSTHCFIVTVTKLNLPEPFPMKVVVDFGTGCMGNDGRLRSGKVVTVYTGRLIHAGKSATTTFENFKIDSIQVSGTHKITNTTVPGSLQRQFTVNVTDGKLVKPSGNYSLWTSTRVITQIEGNLTVDIPADDIFSITGSAHGKVKRGAEIFLWQSQITEELRKRFICKWITKGVVQASRQNLPAGSPWIATLNFGSGLCDNIATLTINGQTQQITLN
jgi:hypothetical protein